MKDPKSSLKVEVDYPEPKLTPEQEADLKKRLENALVHFFPDLVKEGKCIFIPQPKIRPPSH
jgi:hypothetical protein